MPKSKSSLITLRHFDQTRLDFLFSKALELKKNFIAHGLSSGPYHSGYRGTAALLFFEPSTRTRFSFEAACSRAGFHPLILDGGIGTSLEKGETVEDTIYNIQAMRPLFFVIRCNDQINMEEIGNTLSVPVLNAGWGRRSHPTQALLDALTLRENWGASGSGAEGLRGKKVLFVGDVKHSRVVASHRELAGILGYEIAFCGPPSFLPEGTGEAGGPRGFEKLAEALQWADAVIALRVQKERHDNENLFLLEDYRESFGLNPEALRQLKADGLILHPGPVNYGVEIETEILADPRCKILKQVENGVFLREALIRQLFSGGEEN